MKLSIVTTLYRSESFVAEFYERMSAAARDVTDDYEIVITNDGSPDAALERAVEIARRDPRVRVVDLSRNFGHHKAFLAGLSQTHGDLIFFIDVDLEEQPEWLPEFYRILEAEGADVIYGVQRARAGSRFKTSSGGLFYTLFNAVSDTKIPDNVCTVRLMTRRYADALERLRDRNLFLAGNYAWVGFRQIPFVVDKTPRRATSYSLSRLLQLFLNAITSFSSYPLKAICVLGLVIAGVSTLSGVVTVLYKILFPDRIALGWPSLIVSIWFLGGVIIFFVGIVGIYVAMIYEETKDRPLFIIRGVVDYGSGDGLPERRRERLAVGERSRRSEAAASHD
jgi:putative glycosyltransferase